MEDKFKPSDKGLQTYSNVKLTVRVLKPEVTLVLHQPVVGGLQATLNHVSSHQQYLPPVNRFEQIEQQQYTVLGNLQHCAVVDVQRAVHPTAEHLVKQHHEGVGDSDVTLTQGQNRSFWPVGELLDPANRPG